MSTIDNRLNKNLNFLMMFFLFSLLFVNTLARSEFDLFIYIGQFTVDITFFLMLLMLIRSWIKQSTHVSLAGLYIAIILMSILFSVSFMTSPYMDESFELIQLILLLVYIVGAARLAWDRQALTIAGVLFSFATIFFFYEWIQLDFPTAGFKSIYRNENYLGILLYCLFYFHILCLRLSKHIGRLFFLAITLMDLTLIVMTSARSILIALLSLLVFWTILKIRHKLFSKLIYFVIIGNFLFIGIYVWLSHVRLGTILNEWSRSLFNKNLFSGRTEIWISVMQEVVHKPFFGYGIGVKASHITDFPLTSHNMYLQILMEFGLIGVLLFVFLLIAIWKLLIKRLDHFVGRWSSCFMLSILVYLSFELTLFQNNYSIALFQWLIMTVGINIKDKY